MAKAAPVIDFSAYSLDRDAPDSDRFHDLADHVHKALTTIGFMYLKDFGIPASKIDDAFRSFRQFFLLPPSTKLKYEKPDDEYYGYVQPNCEVLNPNVPYKDLKETFSYFPVCPNQPFPDDNLPEFKAKLDELYHTLIPLHNRILEVMGFGLKLEDPLYFVKRHKHIGTNANLTALRTVYYPPLGDDTLIPEGQIRCGEHSDFGGITLLFQDKQPGLEVKNLNGEWIPVEPIEGTVVVNIGDLMQRWTGDKLIASNHRVVLPDDPIYRHQARQSIVFFGNPDDGALIECIDKSHKYEPITSRDYITKLSDRMFEHNPKE